MPARPDQIALAKALLDGLGVTVADLRDIPVLRAGPTVAEFYVVDRGLASGALVRSYDVHWSRLVASHGTRGSTRCSRRTCGLSSASPATGR